MQIAIDGPAASGKSTAAGMLARRLGFLYIDTGAMYRAVAFESIMRGIDLSSEKEVAGVAKDIKISIIQDPESKRGYKVLINGEDKTRELFTPTVDAIVSHVAMMPSVRKILVNLQREIAKKENVVMAGRDIGSNVLPDADLKIFLTADAEVRAKRRLKELEEKGEKKEFEVILDNIKLRDAIDSTRNDDPLVKTPEAVEVDCSNMSIEEMVTFIEKLVTAKKSANTETTF